MGTTTTTTQNWFPEAIPLINRLQWFVSLGRTGLGDYGAKCLPGLTVETPEAIPVSRALNLTRGPQASPSLRVPLKCPHRAGIEF